MKKRRKAKRRKKKQKQHKKLKVWAWTTFRAGRIRRVIVFLDGKRHRQYRSKS